MHLAQQGHVHQLQIDAIAYTVQAVLGGKRCMHMQRSQPKHPLDTLNASSCALYNRFLHGNGLLSVTRCHDTA